MSHVGVGLSFSLLRLWESTWFSVSVIHMTTLSAETARFGFCKRSVPVGRALRIQGQLCGRSLHGCTQATSNEYHQLKPVPSQLSKLSLLSTLHTEIESLDQSTPLWYRIACLLLDKGCLARAPPATLDVNTSALLLHTHWELSLIHI